MVRFWIFHVVQSLVISYSTQALFFRYLKKKYLKISSVYVYNIHKCIILYRVRIECWILLYCHHLYISYFLIYLPAHLRNLVSKHYWYIMVVKFKLRSYLQLIPINRDNKSPPPIKYEVGRLLQVTCKTRMSIYKLYEIKR